MSPAATQAITPTSSVVAGRVETVRVCVGISCTCGDLGLAVGTHCGQGVRTEHPRRN